MKRMSLALAAVLAVALAGVAGHALAQTAPAVGVRVVDQRGETVGVIERVIAGPDGRPAQVLIRVGRSLKTLPVEALEARGDALAAVLTKAEIEALPTSE